MSWLSFVVVVFTFYAPPLQLSAQMCCNAGTIPIEFGCFAIPDRQALFLMLIVSWLVIWGLISFCLRLIAPKSVQVWIGGLIGVQHPATITRAVLALSVVVLILAFGGLQIVNNALRTAFSMNASTVVLALFALVAEAGRVLEVARRDEDAWQQRPRRKGNSI